MVWRDRNVIGGGHLLEVKDNIPSKLVKTYCFSEENEVIRHQFGIYNNMWLLLGIWKPPAPNELS